MKNMIKAITIAAAQALATLQAIIQDRVKDIDFTPMSRLVQKLKGLLQGKDGKGMSLSKESISE